MSSNGGKKLAVGALIGAAAGFITGVLTAPKSGKETRDDIKNTANKVKRDAEKQLKQLYADLNDLVTKVSANLKQKGTTAQAEISTAIDGAKQSQQKVKEIISAIKNGETSEPELKKAIKDAEKSKKHLAKYLKK